LEVTIDILMAQANTRPRPMAKHYGSAAPTAVDATEPLNWRRRMAPPGSRPSEVFYRAGLVSALGETGFADNAALGGLFRARRKTKQARPEKLQLASQKMTSGAGAEPQPAGHMHLRPEADEKLLHLLALGNNQQSTRSALLVKL
jgi:hypothetical protein